MTTDVPPNSYKNISFYTPKSMKTKLRLKSRKCHPVQDIVKPSSFPWSSLIWVILKKLDASGKQKWRLVIDYRKLNDVTVGDINYPLQNITDILDKLRLSILLSFLQLEVDPNDIPKTEFRTP